MRNGVLENIDRQLTSIIDEFLVGVRERKGEGFRNIDIALKTIEDLLVSVINTMSLNNDFLVIINPFTTAIEKAEAQKRYVDPNAFLKESPDYGYNNINKWVGYIEENRVGQVPVYVNLKDEPEWNVNKRIEILKNNMIEHERQLAKVIEMLEARIEYIKMLMDKANLLKDKNELLRNSMMSNLPEQQRVEAIDKYRSIVERERQKKQERDNNSKLSPFSSEKTYPFTSEVQQEISRNGKLPPVTREMQPEPISTDNNPLMKELIEKNSRLGENSYVKDDIVESPFDGPSRGRHL